MHICCTAFVYFLKITLIFIPKSYIIALTPQQLQFSVSVLICLLNFLLILGVLLQIFIRKTINKGYDEIEMIQSILESKVSNSEK